MEDESGYTRPLERWEVFVKHSINITPYVNYIRALFHDDKRDYIIVKGRGNAVETAMKVIA
jgi:hypothetical protein